MEPVSPAGFVAISQKGWSVHLSSSINYNTLAKTFQPQEALNLETHKAKIDTIEQWVLEKDPVGSKVLESYVSVSNSEIKAGKEQPDHEAKYQ